MRAVIRRSLAAKIRHGRDEAIFYLTKVVSNDRETSKAVSRN